MVGEVFQRALRTKVIDASERFIDDGEQLDGQCREWRAQLGV